MGRWTQKKPPFIPTGWVRLDPGCRTCYYCGELAGSRDHCPPRFYRGRIPADIPMVIVACCVRCNSKLGHLPLFTLSERIDHLETVGVKTIERF